ncbi:MAG: M20/M25/M40 family metallo-hydrolase, partial [Pygmaiobacter sp.]
ATQGADAVEAAASFLLRAYRAVREAEPHDAGRLLKFGVLKGGTVRNALAAHAQLEGSLRAFSSPLLEQMKRSLQSIATETEQETGCALTLHYSMGYPAVYNDVALTARAAAALKNGTLQPVDAPSMTAEDFAFYGQQVPSVFFFLGTGRSDALHSDTFDFDETALMAGVACYERLLWI